MSGARWYHLDGPGYSVRVWADDDIPLGEEGGPNRTEAIAALARLACMGIARDRRILACPHHEWEVTFPATYLDGAEDAICRCGARRSDVEPASR